MRGHFDLALNDIVHPLERLPLDVGKTDHVLYFFSIFDRHLKDVLALPAARKIAYFHGITPPKLLQVFDPELSVACRKGSHSCRSWHVSTCWPLIPPRPRRNLFAPSSEVSGASRT